MTSLSPDPISKVSVHDLGQCAHLPSKPVHEVDGQDKNPVVLSSD